MAVKKLCGAIKTFCSATRLPMIIRLRASEIIEFSRAISVLSKFASIKRFL